MGSNWNNLLSSYRNNGLYFLKNPEGTKNEFEKVAQQHGLKPFVINMQNCFGKALIHSWLKTDKYHQGVRREVWQLGVTRNWEFRRMTLKALLTGTMQKRL